MQLINVADHSHNLAYNYVLLSTDVRALGSWRLLDELEDPEL